MSIGTSMCFSCNRGTYYVTYTKNKSLNDVLNETVGLTKSVKQTDDYPTFGGGAFDSTRMAELMGYGKTEDVKRDMVAVDSFRTSSLISISPNQTPLPPISVLHL